MLPFLAQLAAAQEQVPGADTSLSFLHESVKGDFFGGTIKSWQLKKLKSNRNAEYWYQMGGKAGVCLNHDEQGMISRLMFHDGTERWNGCVEGAYTGVMPFALKWGMTLAEVEAVLGPTAAGDREATWDAGNGEFVTARFDDARLSSLRVEDAGWVSETRIAVAKRYNRGALLWQKPHPKPLTAAGFGLAGADALVWLGDHTTDPGAANLIRDYGLATVGDDYDLRGNGGLCIESNWYKELNGILFSSGDRSGCPGKFSGALPFDLKWSMTLDEARKLLGPEMESYQTDPSDWSATWYAGDERYVELSLDGERRLRGIELGTRATTSPATVDWFNTHRGGRLAWKPGTEPVKTVAQVATPVVAPVVARVAPVAPTPQPVAKMVPVVTPVVTPTPPKPEPVVDLGPLHPSLDEPVRTGKKATDESAVVIGLESYPFLGTGVPYARRDAQAFADFLIYTRGVPGANVQTLTGGSREQILAAIDRAAAKGGTVWVYFAGHGAASPQTGDRMLLGDDVRADPVAFASRGVGVGEIERRVKEKGGSARLVLDTCYTGASRNGGSIVGGTRFAVPAFVAAPQAGGTQWNAAGPDQISAPLDDAKHGAFTYFAIGALRGWADGELDGARDGKVTAAEAEAFVSRALRRSGVNGQTPVWVGPDDITLSEGAKETYTIR